MVNVSQRSLASQEVRFRLAILGIELVEVELVTRDEDDEDPPADLEGRSIPATSPSSGFTLPSTWPDEGE